MERFIFDIEGTLLEKDLSYEEKYFKSIFNSEDAFKILSNMADFLSEYEKNYFRYDINLLSSYLSEKTGVTFTSEIVKKWIEAGYDCTGVIPGAKEVLEYLKDKNKSIVALSNWFTDANVERLKRAGLFDCFDEVYCSDRVDMKPNISSYITACGQFSFKDTVMIGDSLENDVLTPLGLGMDAVYFYPNERKEKGYSKIKVIKNLKEIKEIY